MLASIPGFFMKPRFIGRRTFRTAELAFTTVAESEFVLAI